MVTATKGFMYSKSDRQLDDIFEGGNMVPHESVYIWKINLQKSATIHVYLKKRSSEQH